MFKLTARYDVCQIGLYVLVSLVAVPRGLYVTVHFYVRFFRRHQEPFFARAVPATSSQPQTVCRASGRWTYKSLHLRRHNKVTPGGLVYL